MRNILAIGAHYDDIEIGCAGTILKHIEKGDNVYFAITHTDEHRTGNIVDRLHEQDKALELMGISKEPRYLFLFAETDTDSEIIGVLDQIKPDIIYCHYDKDTHQAHRRTFGIGQAVGRKQQITTLFYDSGSTYEFYPNLFSMIDYKKKDEILKCYKSQIECGAINLDRVKKKNSYWASIVTSDPKEYAEGFVSRKLKWEI